MNNLTPEVISGGAAVLLSVLATYIPGLNTWHAALSTQQKQLLWAGLLLATAAGAVAWGCTAAAGCVITDWREWVVAFVGALLLGIGGNQGVHQLLPEPAAVAAVRTAGAMKRGKF